VPDGRGCSFCSQPLGSQHTGDRVLHVKIKDVKKPEQSDVTQYYNNFTSSYFIDQHHLFCKQMVTSNKCTAAARSRLRQALTYEIAANCVNCQFYLLVLVVTTFVFIFPFLTAAVRAVSLVRPV